jgi:hypothetical protein
MRWRALLVLALATAIPAPARGQEGEAEELFQSMEKKVLAADTLLLEFDSEHTHNGKIFFKFKGTIYAAAPNRSRVELDITFTLPNGEQSPTLKNLTVINGESRYWKFGTEVSEGKKVGIGRSGKALLAAIARIGPSGVAWNDKTLDDEYAPVKNFKLGVKEKVGEREAQIVEYQLEKKSGKIGPELFSVWIDTKTQLPLKHLMAGQVDGRKQVNTDTYRAFTAGKKLEAKLFEIPPK